MIKDSGDDVTNVYPNSMVLKATTPQDLFWTFRPLRLSGMLGFEPIFPESGGADDIQMFSISLKLNGRRVILSGGSQRLFGTSERIDDRPQMARNALERIDRNYARDLRAHSIKDCRPTEVGWIRRARLRRRMP